MMKTKKLNLFLQESKINKKLKITTTFLDQVHKNINVILKDYKIKKVSAK